MTDAELSGGDLTRSIDMAGTLKRALAGDPVVVMVSTLYGCLAEEAKRRGWDPPDSET
jgi:hypothetical protein